MPVFPRAAGRLRSSSHNNRTIPTASLTQRRYSSPPENLSGGTASRSIWRTVGFLEQAGVENVVQVCDLQRVLNAPREIHELELNPVEAGPLAQFRKQAQAASDRIKIKAESSQG